MENSSSSVFEYYNTPDDIYQSSANHKYLPFKPKNTLDYLAYNDSEYKTYKLTERIKVELIPFNFNAKVVTEIIQICTRYQYQFKFSVILPIVIYKIIQKYNFPITMMELATKINFDKSNYLKYSSFINIGNNHKTSLYKDNVLNYINFIISKVVQISKSKPRIIKHLRENDTIANQQELNDLFKKFESSTKTNGIAFEDNEKVFLRIKAKCKEFIYCKPISLIKKNKGENDDDNDNEEQEDYFSQYFEEKINDKHLSIAIFKWMMKKEGLSINLVDLRDIFAISLSSISKSISMLKKYEKIYGILHYKGID